MSDDDNDVITFSKTNDVWGHDNLTHYYGGGLIAIEGATGGLPSALNVNSDCFTVREGTKTDDYKYYRYWTGDWNGDGKSFRKEFRSFVFLNDLHNDDSLGTYDDPYSADRYKAASTFQLTTGDDYLYMNFGTNKNINILSDSDYIANYGANHSTIVENADKDIIYNKNSKIKAFCMVGDGNTDSVTIDGTYIRTPSIN